MTRALLATTACALLLPLSACGGGGGVGGGVNPIAPPPPAPTPSPTPTPTPPPPTPTGQNYDTAEYRNSNAAVAANAIAAYDKGATGKGVKLAVVDSGINPSLSEFAGRIDPASRDVAGSRGVSDEDGHGTAVSAVAAAAKNDVYMHGVAFDATILSFRADTPGTCADTDPDNGGCSFGDTAIAAGVDAARNAGARVINLSLGGSAPGTSLLAAMGRAVNAGIILVISAGNDGEEPKGANADPFAAIPASRFPGQVIIAGSVGTFNSASRTTTGLDQISPFSNRAGSSANFTLMALGAGVKTIDQTGGRFFYSGTSFSAPAISGAVALMAQAFPNLTSREIVEILFNSADDLGAAGVDSTYGRGRLNLAKAFAPAGKTSLAGSQTPVTDDGGEAPPAAGDAPIVPGGLGAIVLDGYSRAYAVNLARTLKVASQSQPLHRALSGSTRIAGASAGPVSVAMTVSENRTLRRGFALERLGVGPEDARNARLIAGSMVARIDNKTAVALGFAEGAKAMERRLAGVDSGAFLVARDVAGTPGFDARRSGGMAIRRNMGPVGVTLSSERGEVWQDVRSTATGSPYSWTSLAVDRNLGRTWVSAGLSRLSEKQTLLGGRMGPLFGGGGSDSLFLDLEARRSLGAGVTAAAMARRGWTDFATGRFESAAYAFDVSKQGLFGPADRLGFRLSQPLRIASGGLAMTLPTAYSYETETPAMSLERFSLSPRGREIDAELSYGSPVLGSGWLGTNLFVRRQPGHFAAADADVGGAVRFTLGF